jgi:anti-sigma regulatory factor (Ser/Thr protein kinase)
MARLAFAVPCVNMDLDAVARSVGEIRRRLTAFATEVGANADVRARIALAVTEAATNVVMHAYPGRPSRPLYVAADFEDGDLEVIVADEGEGLRPGPSPGMGAGLAVIAETCDELVVREREGGGVELWMRFRTDA